MMKLIYTVENDKYYHIGFGLFFIDFLGLYDGENVNMNKNVLCHSCLL